MSGMTAMATCPAPTVIETYFILYTELPCPVMLPGERKLINHKTSCTNSFTCYFLTYQKPGKIASIYYNCKDTSIHETGK